MKREINYENLAKYSVVGTTDWEEISCEEQEDIIIYLKRFVENPKYEIFVFEIILGRDPNTDVRTYTYNGAACYETEDDYKPTRYTMWHYSESVFDRKTIMEYLK